MPCGGLDRDAAGVEGHALADERGRLAAVAGRRSSAAPAAAPRAPSPGRRRAARPCRASPSPRVEHLDLDSGALERCADALDEAFGIDDVGGLGDQLAGQRHAFVDRRQRVGVALRRARAAADDDDLAERRLLLVLELGPVAVVAPRAKRGGEPDPGRRIGVEVEAAEIDDGCRFARRQQARRRARRRAFRPRRRARSPPPVPTTSSAPRASLVVDELLGGARRLALEPLAVERRNDRGLRRAERRKRRAVLARDRKHERKIPRGPAVGETNLHLKSSLERRTSAGALGCKCGLGKAGAAGLSAALSRCDRQEREGQSSGRGSVGKDIRLLDCAATVARSFSGRDGAD